MSRALVDLNRCFEVGGRFEVVALGIGLDLEGESLSEEVPVWCLREFVASHRLEGTVVGVQVEVVTAVAAAVVQQPHRMEQGHCVGEGSLEVRMAAGGIVVLVEGWECSIFEYLAEVVWLAADTLHHNPAADVHIGTMAELGSSKHPISSHSLDRT